MLAKPYDCRPTLTDAQVIDFCINGFLLLKGVVPDDINKRTAKFLETHTSYEPTEILTEDWFVEGVIKNPQAAGAVRSLLGANFKLPVVMSNHQVHCPNFSAQGWHRDGGSIYTPRLDYLQVFYYPQETPVEMGPTEVVPCSHFMQTRANWMSHYGRINTAVSTASPAGSIFLTVYSIWHRRVSATSTGVRNLLKYNYWRTATPTRDWVADPNFNFSTRDFGGGRSAAMFEQFRECIAAAEMFTWLCGLGDQYQFKGGQGWPVVPTVKEGDQQEGIPDGLLPGKIRTRRQARTSLVS